MSFYKIFDSALSEEKSWIDELGKATYLRLNSIGRNLICSPNWMRLVLGAIRQGNIHFFYCSSGCLQAYVIWAHLSVENEQRVAAGTLSHLHPSDWNESENISILEIISLNNNLNELRMRMIKILNQREM